MKLKVEGIPSKPQALVLFLMVVYVIFYVWFLCTMPERSFSPNVKKLVASLGILLLIFLLIIFDIISVLFPNIKEIVSSISSKYSSVLNDYGYDYKKYTYDKKRKIIEVYFSSENLPDICFVNFIKSVRNRYHVPYLHTNGRYINIWSFVDFLLPEKIENDIYEYLNYLGVEIQNQKKEIYLAIDKFAKLELHRVYFDDTRKADYYLSCYEGACYIDFSESDGLVYLERISFDRYGCFEIANKGICLSLEESELFRQKISFTYLDQETIRPLVLKLIRQNADKIDSDVFMEYNYLK